jgi:hypothetical protein
MIGGMVSKFDPDQPAEASFGEVKRFFKNNFPPRKFRQLYRFLGAICLDRCEEIFGRYSHLSNGRALLIAIANAKASRIEIPYQAAEFASALTLDRDGKILVQPGPLLELVKDVEGRRIRQCSECNRIFWAGRMDKLACTRKCVQRRRVRLWRERYAESYKQQRVKKANAAESTGTDSNNKIKIRRKSQ